MLSCFYFQCRYSLSDLYKWCRHPIAYGFFSPIHFAVIQSHLVSPIASFIHRLPCFSGKKIQKRDIVENKYSSCSVVTKKSRIIVPPFPALPNHSDIRCVTKMFVFALLTDLALTLRTLSCMSRRGRHQSGEHVAEHINFEDRCHCGRQPERLRRRHARLVVSADFAGRGRLKVDPATLLRLPRACLARQL